ncbi:MAG TPA: hypothetical protein PKC24_01040 [Cyclobacteriaceae bacterium]|nr:hypothetical protein [Cyclobacteriaceae bacterium]
MNRKVILVFSLVLFLAIAAEAQQYKNGIGVRLGDPTSITYKMYGKDGTALEFALGSTSAGWWGGYYRNSFGLFSRYKDFFYVGHTVNSTVVLQGRFLKHKDLVTGIEGKFDWYYGFGGAMRLANIDYTYRETQNGPIVRSNVNNISIGPEAILGLEYLFQDAPVSVFAEASLMMEIIARPLTPWSFGAIGVRYNF